MGKAKRRRLRRKKESKPRLAALGSPFQGKGLAWSLPPSSGRRCPEGAEVGWGSGIFVSQPSPQGEGVPKGRIGQERYERERGRSSQAGDIREHPIQRCAVPLPRWGRKRGGGFAAKRKPTPPRCARQPLPKEGARVDTPSFLWKEVPRRGGGWMGIAVFPYHSLPHGRRGAVSISHSQISIYP